MAWQESKNGVSPLVHTAVLRWAQVPSNKEFQPTIFFAAPLLKLVHRSQSQTALSEDVKKRTMFIKTSDENKTSNNAVQIMSTHWNFTEVISCQAFILMQHHSMLSSWQLQSEPILLLHFTFFGSHWAKSNLSGTLAYKQIHRFSAFKRIIIWTVLFMLF